ncbi:MAG: hypothetical protein ACE5H5_05760, partial [Nitrospinota bacterium]
MTQREVPLVLFGFGKVGQAMARLLEERDGFRDQGVEIHLRAVFDRGGCSFGERLPLREILAAKGDGGTVASLPGLGRADISAPEVLSRLPKAILVDTSPTDPETGEPGLSVVRDALDHGHSVALASKGPLVVAFEELLEKARLHGCRLGISAAVGAPLPGLETALVSLHGCRVRGFRGVFNDTANLILRQMETGTAYGEALETARRAGVLETDPRLDVEGWDTAFKVLLLARSFWDPALSLTAARIEGITDLSASDLARSAEQPKRVRLIGSARREDTGRVKIVVGPEALARDDPLYDLEPGEKAAVFDSDLMGRFVVRSGKGGPETTAATIAKDILNMVAHASPF